MIAAGKLGEHLALDRISDRSSDNLQRLVEQAEASRAAYLLTLYGKVFAPYLLYNYGLFPVAAGLLAGASAGWSVLLCLLVADLLTNAYSFFIIVSNHAGDDLYRFDQESGGHDENYLRQILGSVNYRTGSFLNDYLHGYLNYQIEHHLFPDFPPSQLRLIQPHIQALCARHGVPYIQHSVWHRFWRMQAIFVGEADMPRIDTAHLTRQASIYRGNARIAFQACQSVVSYAATDHGKTLLQLAREQQVAVKSACTKGKCGRCKKRLVGGSVTGNVIADAVYLCTSYPASASIELADF